MLSQEIQEKLSKVFAIAIEDKQSKENELVSETWSLLLESLTFAPLLKALLEDLEYSELGQDPLYFALYFMTAKSASEWWSTSVQDAVFAFFVDEQGESQEFADDEIESIETEISEVFPLAKFEKIRSVLVDHMLK